MRRLPQLLIPLALAACASNPTPTPPEAAGATRRAPTSGEELLEQMHATYSGTWYRTLTFVQRTSFPNRPAETWYEAGAIPGKLRIDIAPIDSMNATMYVGDSAYTFRRGRLVNSRKDRNLLMTLGFDVYGQPPATTAAQVAEQGVDLSRIQQGTWQGRPVWIVGAAAGDTTSSQFWVDAERMLFVRLIQKVTGQNNQGAMLDVEFNKYQRLSGGWIAPEVVIRINGREIMREEYRDMRADVDLPPDLYTTTEYRRPGWVDASVQ
ncbi:MAG TPA: hypothetical protein VFT04_12445 [Gemmatimonadales bacterium]|nr:hypothetical protein [Gemmatimonadales bacterium]